MATQVLPEKAEHIGDRLVIFNEINYFCIRLLDEVFRVLPVFQEPLCIVDSFLVSLLEKNVIRLRTTGQNLARDFFVSLLIHFGHVLIPPILFGLLLYRRFTSQKGLAFLKIFFRPVGSCPRGPFPFDPRRPSPAGHNTKGRKNGTILSIPTSPENANHLPRVALALRPDVGYNVCCKSRFFRCYGARTPYQGAGCANTPSLPCIILLSVSRSFIIRQREIFCKAFGSKRAGR